MTKPANSHVGRSDESGDIPVKPKHLGLRVLTPRFFRTSEAGVYLRVIAPNAGETSDLWHRSGLSEARQPCCL